MQPFKIDNVTRPVTNELLKEMAEQRIDLNYGGRDIGKTDRINKDIGAWREAMKSVRSLPFISSLDVMGPSFLPREKQSENRDWSNKINRVIEIDEINTFIKIDKEEGDSAAVTPIPLVYPIDNAKIHLFEGLEGPIPYPVGKEIKVSINAGRCMARCLNTIFGNNDMRLICAGSSGAILSSIIATQLASVVEIIHVKKAGEESHHWSCTSELKGDFLNIIVDDFIASGRTINMIYDKFTQSNCSDTVDGLIVNSRVHKETIRNLSISNIICARYS